MKQSRAFGQPYASGEKKVKGREVKTPTKKRASVKARVIAALRKGANFGEAAEAAGVNTFTIWQWRKDEPEFDKEVNDARDAALPSLEDVLYRCAHKAEGDPRYQVSTFFALVNRAPDRWQHRQNFQHEVKGELQILHPDLAKPGPDAARAAQAAAAEAKQKASTA